MVSLETTHYFTSFPTNTLSASIKNVTRPLSDEEPPLFSIFLALTHRKIKDLIHINLE